MRHRIVSRHLWATAAGLALLAATACTCARSAPVTATQHAPRPQGSRVAMSFPQTGVLLRTQVAAHTRPAAGAPAVRVLPQFRSDFRPTQVLAVAGARGADGRLWVKLNLPMRPNGSFGWVPAAALSLKSVYRSITVDRSARTLVVYDHARPIMWARVAVGAPGMETPVGHFFIQAQYKSDEAALGAYAFETSGYSKLSDWPGGGIVGIHGTPQPWLIGKAVSHGCIRIANSTALALRRLVSPGTPVTVVP